MGMACPDTAPCDERYYGFFNQVYGAARQLKVYGLDSFFNSYPVGRTSNVLYHPNAACGSAPVYIANKATAALYYYTPYQPNQAALNAGYGTGDGCSSYGNRNFYLSANQPAVPGYTLNYEEPDYFWACTIFGSAYTFV